MTEQQVSTTTKKCSCCGEVKDFSCFSFKSKKKGTLVARCKLCVRAINRQHYSDNKDKYLSNKKDRIISNKDWYKNYKETLACSECGFSNPKALQFHHKDSNKEGNVGTMVHNGCSIDKVMKEIHKCVVLCANCHMILHANERIQ